ncbi:MAG: alanine racemase [Actinomycetales bacterium]|nr:alanine racemase [Actinomycetales bacterium]
MSAVGETTAGPSAAQHAGWTPEARARGAVATVDLDALRSNLARCAEAADGAQVMAVVKADAYGHGLVPCARAALEGGATWLGAALPTEAIALRDAGVGGRVLTWLAVPGAPFAGCLTRDVDVSVSALWALEEVCAAARATGVRARVHLKADTGLSRNGATPDEWPALVSAARVMEAEGLVEVVGLWSHLASADAPTHPSVARQLDVFDEALGLAEAAGLRPEVRHLANSAGTLGVPRSHHDLVRVGIAMYGLSPGADIGTARDLGLRPVMTLRARLASVKRIRAGAGVSYGHEYTASRDTTVGLVPLGYADGIPRAAANAGPILAAGAVRTVAGRVCMDQVVVDLGDDEAEPGDEVVVFGAGGPSADDWAAACGTIGYEIVTRIGPRVPRVPVGVTP